VARSAHAASGPTELSATEERTRRRNCRRPPARRGPTVDHAMTRGQSIHLRVRIPGPKPAASAARTNSSNRTVTRGASGRGRDSLVRGRARSRRGAGALADEGGVLALGGVGAATRAESFVNFTRMSRASRARSNSRPSCLRVASSSDGCRSGCPASMRTCGGDSGSAPIVIRSYRPMESTERCPNILAPWKMNADRASLTWRCHCMHRSGGVGTALSAPQFQVGVSTSTVSTRRS